MQMEDVWWGVFNIFPKKVKRRPVFREAIGKIKEEADDYVGRFKIASFIFYIANIFITEFFPLC